MSLVSVVCCHVEISATDRSLVYTHRRPTEYVCVRACACVSFSVTKNERRGFASFAQYLLTLCLSFRLPPSKYCNKILDIVSWYLCSSPSAETTVRHEQQDVL